MKENPMFKALVLALSLAGFQAFAETKFNISGDAYVRGYFLNGTGPAQTQAFAQFLRVNADAKTDEHLTLKTGLVLAAENWEGDTHSTYSTGGLNESQASGVSLGKGNTTHLDHAVIEYSKDSWVYSAGRHAVSTPGCFLTCDDRRDRIQVAKLMANYDLFAFAYDKRYEGTLNNGKDDTDMITLAYYGSIPMFKYALQFGYFHQTKNLLAPVIKSLDNIKQFTPQISTNIMGVDLNAYYSVLWGGSELYVDTHHSTAIRLTKDFGLAKLDYQSIFTVKGGFIATGFDSLSSIINNNPDHNQSLISLRSIGSGLGNTAGDESVHMIKISKNITNDFSASVGGGIAKVLPTFASTKLESNTVLDATAKYTVSSNLNLAAAYGTFLGDNEDHAGSLTLNANF
jgi:hypothetical protein